MSGDVALHDRVSTWHLRVRAAMATQRLDLPFAIGVITDDLPAVYDLNLVDVTAHVPPAVLLRSVERLASSAGWLHRRIEIGDARIAERLRRPLTDAGYNEERFATMALADAPAPVRREPRSARTTALVDRDEQDALARAVTAQEPWADSDALVDQMMERERRLQRITNGRLVIAPPDAPVSRCMLLEERPGGLSEIDAVSTLVDHRGQGWSAAVVRRAIAEARSRDAEHIVLVADLDDWPLSWYGRLGFRVVGHSFSYHRDPDGADDAGAAT